MSETTTTRDLLAEAMHEAMCCNDPEKVVVDGFREAADDLLLLTDWQDAIVAERVAALADDEALLWRVARADYDMHAGDGAGEFDDDWVTQAEQTLHALAAALADRGADA